MSDLTDAEWREFQATPEQGYSHRYWVNYKIRERAAAVWEEACQWNREQGMGISNSAEHNPYTK